MIIRNERLSVAVTMEESMYTPDAYYQRAGFTPFQTLLMRLAQIAIASLLFWLGSVIF